jgi:alpha-glucoside transport system permease protein
MSQAMPAATPPSVGASGTALPGTTVNAPGRKGLPFSNWLGLLVFLGPALFLIGVFVVYPTLRTVQLSFYEQTGIGTRAPLEFVGLDNYKFMLEDEFIRKAVLNNLLWLVLVTPLTVALGVILAVLFDRVRYEPVAKSILFVPMAISATATAVIWKLVYAPNPNVGTLNAVLGALIPGFQPVSWLGRTDLVNFAIMAAHLWASAGFAVVVLSAALKAIPSDLKEAARVDGATELQIFRRITVPLLWPTITVIATLTMIGVLKIFDIVFTMTGGGPAGASEVIGTRMYTEAFKNNYPGYGSAIAVVLLLAVIPIMALNIRRFRSEGAR